MSLRFEGKMPLPELAVRRSMATAISLLILTAFCACSPNRAINDGGFVLVEAGASTDAPPQYSLDALYPAATQIVIASGKTRERRKISGSLYAAGQPVISPNAAQIYFAGKTRPGTDWQIWQYTVRGNTLRQVTTMPGGACSPALLPNGDVIFSSPAMGGSSSNVPALYAQTPGKAARRLTFGITPATEPTILRDGRILFVSPAPASANAIAEQRLFTINSDGTELAPYALANDGAPLIRRPRQLNDGRVAFLSSSNGTHWTAESVRLARPFLTRTALAEAPQRQVSAVDALTNQIVICGPSGSAVPGVTSADGSTIEVLPLTARPKPMGHLSTINFEKATGTLLCLDANVSRNGDATRTARTTAAAVRIFVSDRGGTRSIGTVPLHADGSFLVHVPSDVPIGFETLDGTGRSIRRLHPFMWVRPGENRSCVGCHEPYNRSPGNARPIAANFPAVVPQPETRNALTAHQTPP